MCSKCGVDYPKTKEFYYKANNRKERLRTTCKAYDSWWNKQYLAKKKGQNVEAPKWLINLRKSIIELRRPQIVHPALPIKDSEYHKSLERTDTNTAFFNHLCSGKDFFKTLQTLGIFTNKP